MAYSSIIKPTDYFNTKLYTGNGNSNTKLLQELDFQPDFGHGIKNRSGIRNDHHFNFMMLCKRRSKNKK